MRNKISIKIGLLFFCLIFAMEVCLFFALHNKIAQTRINEQLSALVTRGNNHRDVLETYYNDETIHHIALMEAKSDTEVVITDEHGYVIISSAQLTDQMEVLIKRAKKTNHQNGEVIEDNWKSGSYIATVTPFSTESHRGYVYMFQETGQFKALMKQLNKHFIMTGLAAAVVTAVIILITSKGIARPLIRMKEATKELSMGNFSIQVPIRNNDELGELAQSIQLLADELNHLKSERSEFLSSVSHELKTPLTYIKGYAEVAKREQLSNEERVRYLTIIEEETTKLTELVRELIQLAQMDYNTFSIHKEWISVCDVLKRIMHKTLPLFKQEDKELEFICPEYIKIFADPVRFEQVIFNLLENARKYSKAGTLTRIKVEKGQKNVITITIQDEGRGIPVEDQPFIFQRFYRVDKSRSRESGGTGLGLSIVKEIIEAHKWEITLSSTLNEGTKATIIVKGE